MTGRRRGARSGGRGDSGLGGLGLVSSLVSGSVESGIGLGIDCRDEGG